MIGIVIFLIGLFLVLDHKNQGFCFCRKNNSALDILRERYARGEITTDEFFNTKNTLN